MRSIHVGPRNAETVKRVQQSGVSGWNSNGDTKDNQSQLRLKVRGVSERLEKHGFELFHRVREKQNVSGKLIGTASPVVDSHPGKVDYNEVDKFRMINNEKKILRFVKQKYKGEVPEVREFIINFLRAGTEQDFNKQLVTFKTYLTVAEKKNGSDMRTEANRVIRVIFSAPRDMANSPIGLMREKILTIV